MNGWEFLDTAENDEKIDLSQCVIYMLTTSSNPDDKAKAIDEYKLKNYFLKPLTESHISTILND